MEPESVNIRFRLAPSESQARGFHSITLFIIPEDIFQYPYFSAKITEP